MKQILLGITLIILSISLGFYVKRKYYDPKRRLEIATTRVTRLVKDDQLQNGDIIFQTSLSRQSKAIQLATHSEYSHCGLIYRKDNDYFVFEAVEPVKFTTLNKWISRGKDEHFVVKRLKNADSILTPSTLAKMKQLGDKFTGRHYDVYFEWSDDRIYCSELIWKIYKEATGLEVGKLEKLKDFDLTSEPVQQKMKERYGNKIPADEIVISPVSIYKSELLKTVASN